MNLKRYARSHIREMLINCREEKRDAGLGELLRADEQYESLLGVNARLLRALTEMVGHYTDKDFAQGIGKDARALLRELGEDA